MAIRGITADQLFVEGKDLTGDVSQFSCNAPIAMLDKTTIGKLAMDRLQGLRDGSVSFTNFFDDATGLAHLTLGALPTTAVGVMVLLGASVGNVMFWVDGFLLDYPPTRGADGSLTIPTVVQATGAVPLEYGRQLTAGKITDASASSEVGIVDGAQTTAGARLYAQVFGLTSGTPDIVAQDSSDSTNGIDGSWGTLLDMAINPTSVGAARETISGVVEKGIRSTVTGTYSNLIYALGVNRGTANDIEDLS